MIEGALMGVVLVAAIGIGIVVADWIVKHLP
jgi:hypothetical protein